jgi:uncharacterized protein YyaL (SSP411 family)
MERESFEDAETAALMNERFINIKVDREERPDIDQIYMRAVQAMTGRGGWPLTVFLTPDRIPFFGGTYYPPEPQPGMPSFRQVLESISDAWNQSREEVLEGSTRLLTALSETGKVRPGEAAGVHTLAEARRQLSNQYDATHGGFGRAPKFPQPVTLEFLLRQHGRTNESRPLEMVVHTLRRMAAGGLRDHLAGGFHRYSVDARWLVPHFEKMLYDNALLASAYLDAFRITDSDDLRTVATQTLDYLATDLRAPDGAFYSARDADSDGEEGWFYLWTRAEVDALLEPETARLFRRVYDISEDGNFEGRSIPHLPHEVSAVAESEAMRETDLERTLATARAILLEHRRTRPAPFRDEKVIVSWNGLAIRAFAEAGAMLDREDYVQVAAAAADFLWENVRSSERLLHSWTNGTTGVPGFLDDHAALGNALLSLHGATLEGRWLQAAVWLCEEIIGRFRDESTGTLFDTANDAEELILRPRDAMDNATPSGPSLAAELLARAGSIMGEPRYVDAARAIVDAESGAMGRYGPAFGRMLCVLDRLEAEPVEIAIIAPAGARPTRLIAAAHEVALPNLVVAGRIGDEAGAETPLLLGRGSVDGLATVYVCGGHTCDLPTTDVDGLRARLRELRAP